MLYDSVQFLIHPPVSDNSLFGQKSVFQQNLNV